MATGDRLVVTRSGKEHTGTSQSGGLALVTGVGPQHTPATKLWFGKASNKPGFRSLPHHHGEAETGAYLLSGRARVSILARTIRNSLTCRRRLHVRSAVPASPRSQYERDRRTLVDCLPFTGKHRRESR